MLVKQPKYRRALSEHQVGLLKLIFKFRFVSVDLLAEKLGKERSTVYENLFILSEQGYISKQYNSSYRLLHRPAIYCLASKGIRYLLQNSQLSQSALRNMYKNKSISEEHINHCLLTFKVCLALNRQTNELNIYSKFELSSYDWFIRPLPDLYIHSKQDTYLLDIFDANLPFFVMRRRLRAHQDFSEQEWNEDELGPYPNLLLVVPNDRVARRLLEEIESIFQDFEIYTTTIERLFNSNNGKVWRSVFEEEPLSL